MSQLQIISHDEPNGDRKILYACKKHYSMIVERWKKNGLTGIKIEDAPKGYDCQMCPPPKVGSGK